MAIRTRIPCPPKEGVVEGLRERIRQMERPAGRTGERRGIPSGLPGLDALLVDGSFTRGTLVEWISPGEGGGVATLAAAVAGRALGIEGIGVVIDEAGEFYPAAAADLGLSLERLILVRPGNRLDALWAWEQSLRCPGVALTFGRIDRLDDRTFRRLQLAAEAGGGLGFMIRPPEAFDTPSWAATRLVARFGQTHVVMGSPDPITQRDRRSPFGVQEETFGPGRWDGRETVPQQAPLGSDSRRLSIRVVRGQRDSREAFVEVELPDEESPLPVVPKLADPAAAGEAAFDRL